MKPSFALNLSHEGIGLLHRTIRGWSVVGEVALDAPDLGGGMAFLRSTALGLETRGITTKLILPASQVLYTTVTAPGPSAAKRRAQIATALEGQTPYPVSDLVFDWCGTGTTVQVAVVARETLEEAEHFATEHRFNPVSFVAIPDNGQFAGEPFFGTAPSAATLLAGDKVERDQDPVRIVSRAQVVRPEELSATDTAPVIEAVEPVPDDVATVDAALAVAEPVAAEAPFIEAVVPETPPEAEQDPVPEAAAPEAAAQTAAPEAPTAVEEPPEPTPALEPLTLRVSVTAPIVIDDDLPATPEPEPALQKGKREKTAPPPPTEERPTPTFSTRRSIPALEAQNDPPERAAPRIGAQTARDVTPPPKTSAPVPAVKIAAPPAPAVGTTATAAAIRAATMPDAVRAALAAQNARGSNGRAARRPAPIPPRPAAKPSAKDKSGQDADLTRFLPRKPSSDDVAAAPGERGAIPLPPRPATEAEAMTVFGERRKSKESRTPRYLGLILTVILLALLGAVALWSTLYLSQATAPNSAATDTAATAPGLTATPALTPSTAPAAAPAETAAVPVPAVTAPSVPDQPDTSADPQAVAEVADKAMAVPDLASLSAADATNGAPVAGASAPEPAAMALLASPGLPPPSRPDAATAIALASIDPRLSPTAIAMLPGPGADTAPVIPSQPPAAPDANAPAGVAAIAPSAAPAISAPAITQAPAGDVAPATTGALPEPPPGADPALAKFKPKPRPAALATEPAPVETASPDTAPATGGPSLAPATAKLRPKSRPTTGVFAPDITGSASPAADATSDLAVAASPRPADRPKSLDVGQPSANSGVAAALALAGSATAAQPAAPKVDVEPVSSPMPSLPSNASVAAESTINGALNLNRINLIGVFGTTSDRSALVRMPGGKVVRVQVGDTLDGGRIAAIGEDNLYYVKNGQNVQLKMPNG